MAIPMIAAGIAARAIAKKLATRAAGGITGAGAKQVAPVYREQGFSNSVLSRPSYTPKNYLGGSSSVKVIPQSSISKTRAENVTAYNTSRVKDAKSGKAAKRAAKNVEQMNELKIYSLTKPPLKTVKINSNPTRAR
jgi:hypothetical protein